MRVLLLAPHPYYQERGTPIAVDLLVQALIELGHYVDVLTYHEGQDRDHGPAARIYRIPPPPWCRNIRPGFSLKKVVSDFYLWRMAHRMVREKKYDVIHAVEESAFIARYLKKKTGTPYIFDMDSSMPVQIADALPVLKFMLPVMRHFENKAICDACAITAVCDALADIARNAGAKSIFLLRDVPLLAENKSGRGFGDSLKLDGPILLYIGNLEAYQGIDLLLMSFARLPTTTPASLVIVGGIAKHIDAHRLLAQKLGIDARTHFLGPRPIGDMNALMKDADILVSPRTKGQNTPMKVYSYMASGKAILATDLPTHTQALDASCAMLAAPEPEAFSRAMQTLLNDPSRRSTLGLAAKEKVEEQYSLAVFNKTVAGLYQHVAEVA